VFAFRTECCSDSHRNGVRLQNGIAFAFDRIPQKKASVNEIYHYAKVCRVGNVIRPYMEAL
jgi:hypothetical protein